MTIYSRAKKFQLPVKATRDDLEYRGLKTFRYGDRVVACGYFYNNVRHGTDYYGVVYGFLDDDRSYDGFIELLDVSDNEFEDDGSALRWALNRA